MQLLGDPATCPHGNPIPGSQPSQPSRPTIALADAQVGPITVARVSERLEMSTRRSCSIAGAHLMPGLRRDRSPRRTPTASTVTTDNGEHRVPHTRRRIALRLGSLSAHGPFVELVAARRRR